MVEASSSCPTWKALLFGEYGALCPEPRRSISCRRSVEPWPLRVVQTYRGVGGLDGIIRLFLAGEETQYGISRVEDLKDYLTCLGDPSQDADTAALRKTLDGPLFFTIGELAAENIMVKDEKFVRVVGWKRAGFYPPAFEYITTRWVFESGGESEDDGVVLEALPPFEKEYKQALRWLH